MPPMPTTSPTPPSLFPIYLIPSLPFRRRKSSVDSTISTPSTFSTSSDFVETDTPPTYLTNATSHLRCARCAADLALSTQIISKGFTGRHGRAYLVAPHRSAVPLISQTPARPYATWKAKNDALPNLPNTFSNKPVPRQLVTGMHTVADINCAVCGSVLGWKYVHAEEEGQKYKIGKFILETRRVCRIASWEGEGEDENGVSLGDDGGRRDVLPLKEMPRVEEEEVEFDSQDEDECEDLFMGVWTKQSAMQIRARKARQFALREESD